MSQPEQFEVLVLGSGQGGQLIAWHLAQAGRRTALVERRWIGGSCPNIACLPSKNEIWSARVAHLAQHGAQFGRDNRFRHDRHGEGSATASAIWSSREIDLHLQNFRATGTELIVGMGALWRRRRWRFA